MAHFHGTQRLQKVIDVFCQCEKQDFHRLQFLSSQKAISNYSNTFQLYRRFSSLGYLSNVCFRQLEAPSETRWGHPDGQAVYQNASCWTPNFPKFPAVGPSDWQILVIVSS